VTIAVRARLSAALLVALTACSTTPNPSAGTTPPAGTSTGSSTTTGASGGTTDAGAATTVGGTTPALPSAVAFDPVVTGLDRPVDVAWQHDNSTMYVVEQPGKVVPVRNGVVGAPVVDLGGEVSTGSEQGLLGLAFHPTRPLAYADYTNLDGDTVIAEFPVNDDGTFLTSSRRTVLTVHQPYANHNGGNVVFGPDGLLYIGMGDGGSALDPARRALNPASQLGKILRIDPVIHGDRPYTVPADNPFRSTAGAAPEVWSIGLRNPWRFGFDPSNGDLWIADVGQNKWEEVDVARAADGAGRGANFGWSALEGTHRANADQPTTGAIAPVYEYPHGADGCSITGGAVYRGSALASLRGWYVFSDYCSGHVRAIPAAAGAAIAVVPLGTVPNTSAIRNAPDGEVYVLSISQGTVFRITAASS